ncbi:MAG: hypothetical protein ACR5LG_13695 [Sodalis sp. (in: enterobacteria)]|uniref:hypothetical protein n=1 Tax=Sodalis sp. (in: enterobacteria) TaxID=1898979 RepID=UPI003F3DDCF2
MPAHSAGEAEVIWQRAERRWPQFVLREPRNGLPPPWANGSQVSFAASSPDATASSVALTLGAVNEGELNIRPQYAPDFYSAYCRDPEGNKLCFVYAKRVNG